MPTATRHRAAHLDRRTRSARAERRDARATLLRAAAAVFSERGFRDASVEDIAHRAGYSKGAIYWHFESKDDLFLALLEERLERPIREMIELLESAPPEQDMGPEASRRFIELLESERELLLLQQEYWSQAVRDSKLRARYASRRAELRAAFGRAISTRLEHLGAPPGALAGETMATVIMGLSAGLAQERLIDPGAVPDGLLGDTVVLLYFGVVARAERTSRRR
jgi:AcrR family transcriptional regulator